MSTKLRCLLLDDELPGLAYLRMLCEQIPDVEVVRAFNDPQKFLEALQSLDYNACILDIEMPKINGLEIAKLIHDKPVIFTTAYKEYAAEAFDLNAVDYVRKPVNRERLEQAVAKALERIRNQPARDFIQLNTDKGKSIIRFRDVLYITSSDTDKRDKIVHMENGSRITLKNISYDGLLSLLPKADFCRINKKDVIAIRIVRSSTHNEVITSVHVGNVVLRLPLSEVYKSDFRRRFL